MTALLVVVRRVTPRSLITTGTVVKIKQDVVLTIGPNAFVAFDLEEVEFFAILMRAAVADVFEKSFVLDHSCDHEPRSSMKRQR